jgi:hypothetical protein
MIKIKYEDELFEVEIVAREMDSTVPLSDFLEQVIKPLLICVGYDSELVEHSVILHGQDDWPFEVGDE